MFAFFDVIAVAFCIALSLYELALFIGAHYWCVTTSSKVVWNPRVQRVQVQPSMPPRSVEMARRMIWARYSRRSLVFHQLNAMQFPDVQPEFRSWPYFGLGLMGLALFAAAGLPALTALGIGVCGGVSAFVSKYGRDLTCFSDEMAQLDDDVRNAHLRVLQMTRAHR
jgi:hypothetical protein